MKFRKAFLTVTGIAVQVALVVERAFAQTPSGPPIGVGSSPPITLINPLSCTGASGAGTPIYPFQCIADKIIGTLTLLTAPILVIMLLVGGLQMMVSAGNEEKFKKGKDLLKYAVIGFAITLFANAATSIITSIFA